MHGQKNIKFVQHVSQVKSIFSFARDSSKSCVILFQSNATAFLDGALTRHHYISFKNLVVNKQFIKQNM